MLEKITNLENLIGTTMQINPQALLNKKRLFTTQSWVDMTKLQNAMKGIPDINEEPPKGWISQEKQGLIYTVGDGNHRIGLACIERGQIPFVVIGIWESGTRYGFNIILNKIRNELAGG